MTADRPLIDKFLDDRDGLTDSELAELVALLRKSPQAAAELKEQLLIDELLRQKLAVDGGDFPAQVDQRIRDYIGGEAAMTEKAAVVQRATQVLGVPPARETHLGERLRQGQRSRSVRFWASVAAGVLVAMTISMAMLGFHHYQNKAVVESIRGDVRLVRDGQAKSLGAGLAAHDGDQFVAPPGGELTLRYGDGTSVNLHGDATVDFHTGWSKRLAVRQGNLSADVTPQRWFGAMRFETPMAEAKVLGTQLLLAVRPAATRLDVREGSVELSRNSDHSSVVVDARRFGIANAEEVVAEELGWPTNPRGAVFYWKRRAGRAVMLASTATSRFFYPIKPHGDARVTVAGEMILAGGSFRPQDAAAELLHALRATGQLTLECRLRPESLNQDGPARIIAFSTDSSSYNFTLGQQSDQLLFRIKTTAAKDKPQKSEVSLCQLPDTNSHHLVVTYRDGQTTCYLDGKRVLETAAIEGDFADWDEQHFLIGNEYKNGRYWRGGLERLAIYNRALAAAEIEANATEALPSAVAEEDEPTDRK